MLEVERETDRYLDRRAAIDRYRAGRRRTAEVFGMLAPEAYHERPIALRNPIVFYEGHLTRGSRFSSSAASTPRTSPPYRALSPRGRRVRRSRHMVNGRTAPSSRLSRRRT